MVVQGEDMDICLYPLNQRLIDRAALSQVVAAP
jgi:hypothetical protein